MRVALAAALCLSLAAAAHAAPTEKDVDDALTAFKKAYASKDESARIAAVEALGATQHRRVVEMLAGPLAKDTAAVRRAAAGALGGQWSPHAVAVLAKALDPDNAPRDVTEAIIAALGRTESDDAVPPLAALLGVRNKLANNNDAAAFTAAALEALGRLGSARAIEDVLSFLNREANVQHIAGKHGLGPEPLLKVAMAALGAITGEKHGTAAQWRVWWSENRGALKEIRVYRCPETGRTFDRIDARTKCPQDGDRNPGCGQFLKTRLEGGGLAAPEAPKKAKAGKNKTGLGAPAKAAAQV